MKRREPKIKRYQKKFDYSYSFGIYPTLWLLKKKKESVFKILLKKNSDRFEGIQEIKKLSEENGIPLEINDRLIDKVAYKENTFAVGVFEKYTCKVSDEGNHIVLVEPRNMGNVGTIIRSMVGFGFKDLVIIGNGVDLFSPKVVSSTMGNFFKINFEYIDNFPIYSQRFSKYHMYPFTLGGGSDILKTDFRTPGALIFGNESKGLGDEYIEVGDSVYIPHSQDLESLNLSVASSIGMWEFSNKLRK